MKIGHRVTDAIQSAGKKFGLHITRSENTLAFKRQNMLDSLGIDVALDVGANVGSYALELRQHGFRGKIVSFEPIAAVYAKLQQAIANDPLCKCHQMALGDEDTETQINVSHNFVSSSLLKVTDASTSAASATAINNTETIRVARLDSIRKSILAPEDRVYMKVDVQGFEKQVLRGAAESLAQIAAIEIELSLVELYATQTLMPEMMSLLAKLGFQPAWLERGFKDPSTGYLLQMDGIFVNRRRST